MNKHILLQINKMSTENELQYIQNIVCIFIYIYCLHTYTTENSLKCISL